MWLPCRHPCTEWRLLRKLKLTGEQVSASSVSPHPATLTRSISPPTVTLITHPLSHPYYLVPVCSGPANSRAILAYASFILGGKKAGLTNKSVKTEMSPLSTQTIYLLECMTTTTWNNCQSRVSKYFEAYLSKETWIIWNWNLFFFFCISNKYDETLKNKFSSLGVVASGE